MENSFEQMLAGVVGVENVRTGEPMSLHTTFRVGGPADYFVTPDSAEAVASVVSLCREAGVALYVMGCGSNLLVADEGLRGVVMRIGPKYSAVKVHGDSSVYAEAGATNAKVARAALEAGLAGFEFAAGIPGSIGGAAIMNAGAYGGELRDVATGVTCLAEDGREIRLSADEADWSYRHSRMADDGSIVLSVDLKLERGEPQAIEAFMAELARRRSDKQPLDLPSAGSTFKRPAGHFAGKLIQDAGMQGHTVGGAQVSTKHAGFVVNIGGATASDILKVIEDVRGAVFQQFGVELEPEVRIWR
ncbi:MAG: UDP-N-acetylmuramate dehydrogenase [Eggerthellaceae bacterium]|nr:UDP-N-acetylmuramate dehydrogenase [Eggerthellaceae bacterium]